RGWMIRSPSEAGAGDENGAVGSGSVVGAGVDWVGAGAGTTGAGGTGAAKSVVCGAGCVEGCVGGRISLITGPFTDGAAGAGVATASEPGIGATGAENVSAMGGAR